MLSFYENAWQHTCGLKIIFKSGSLSEKQGCFGFTHLAEHLMFSGTKKYKQKELSQKHYKYFGFLEARTSYEYVDVTCYFDLSNINIVLDTLQEMIFNWRCPKKDLELEKKYLIQEIKEFGGSTEENSYKQIYKSMGKRLPAIMGTANRIKSIKEADLQRIKKYWQDNILSAEVDVVVVGGKDVKNKLSKIKKILKPTDPMQTKSVPKFDILNAKWVKDRDVISLVVENTANHPCFILLSDLWNWRVYNLSEDYSYKHTLFNSQHCFSVSSEKRTGGSNIKKILTQPITLDEFKLIKKLNQQYLNKITDTVQVINALDWLGEFQRQSYVGLKKNPEKQDIEQYFRSVDYKSFKDFFEEVLKRTS